MYSEALLSMHLPKVLPLLMRFTTPYIYNVLTQGQLCGEANGLTDQTKMPSAMLTNLTPHELEPCLLFCLFKKIVVFIGQCHISLPIPLKMVSDWSDMPNLWPPAPHHKSWSEQDWDLYMALIDLITFHYTENYRNAKSVNHFQFSKILFMDRKRPWSENAPLGVFFLLLEVPKLFEVSEGFKGLIYSEMWWQSHEKRSAHYCKLRPSGMISMEPFGFNILAILTSNNNPHKLLIGTSLKLMTCNYTIRKYFY